MKPTNVNFEVMCDGASVSVKYPDGSERYLHSNQEDDQRGLFRLIGKIMKELDPNLKYTVKEIC